MKKAFHYVGLLALVLSLTGCLKSRTQLNREVDEPEETVQHTQVTEVKPANDQGALVDEMRAEINRLQRKIDDLDRSNKELSTDLSKRQKERQTEGTAMEARIQELEAAQAQMIEALKKRKERTTEDSVDLVAKADKSYKAKDYHQAVDLLNDYLKNPKGTKAEEAHFIRGESYFHMKQYKKAILDYSTINDKFSKSKRVPQCLLKIAQSFDALGMKSDAKIFYQELVDKFPKSAEAKKASAKL